MSDKTPKLVDAKTQAKWFSRIREAHQTETTEDYVELIADLIAAQKEARLADLSSRFGVSNATASKVVTRLKDEGYINTQPYRAIFLTPKGETLAKECKARHQIVLDFLIRLGVDSETAEYDAEGIEHHISAKTLKIFKNFKA
jgi:DtxR family manganese transport transcriptional regulator